eukprot:366112-Chlamydomonas_euryale.AAC.21
MPTNACTSRGLHAGSAPSSAPQRSGSGQPTPPLPTPASRSHCLKSASAPRCAPADWPTTVMRDVSPP